MSTATFDEQFLCEVESEKRSELGVTLIEALSVILIGLILIGAAAYLYTSVMNNSKLAEAEQVISMARMQTQHMFTTSLDYSGLDNTVAIKGGLVPQKVIKGGSLVNGWGGNITVATGESDTGTFSVTFTNVPQEACTRLATYQLDSWLGVSVNGTDIEKTSGVASASENCTDSSTIIYTSR